MTGLLHWLFGKMESKRYTYDAFISHAVEDKVPIANELCAKLEQAGLKIWYSGRELSVGDRITTAIDEGLAESRFGIVILSPTYIRKDWTMREFYSLLSRRDYQKVILPVLYDLTPEELVARDITMADTFALDASKGIDYLVDVLTAEITKQKESNNNNQGVVKRRPAASIGIAALLAVGIGAGAWFSSDTGNGAGADSPTMEVASELVSGRLRKLDAEAAESLTKRSFTAVTSFSEIESDVKEYSDLKTHYRNEYRLDNGFSQVQSKKNVQTALGMSFDSLTLLNHYGLSEFETFRQESSGEERVVRYIFRNTKPVKSAIGELTPLADGTWVFEVEYSENIRLVETILTYPDMTQHNRRKRQQLKIFAVHPSERYLLRKEGHQWVIRYYADQ